MGEAKLLHVHLCDIKPGEGGATCDINATVAGMRTRRARC